MKCKCECLAPWLSGFFALPAVAHLVRIIAGWEIVWNGSPVTIRTSWIVMVVSGLLSLVFGLIARKKHKESGSVQGECCS